MAKPAPIVYAAYSSSVLPAVGRGIFVIDRVGGPSRRILAPSPSRDAPNDSPAWSPDRRRIAFVRWGDGGDGVSGTQIWVADADGRNAHAITHLSANHSGPDWSPDGKRIVFSRTVERRGSKPFFAYDLFTMDPAGKHLVDLTDNRNGVDAEQPAWSPDGKRIAFWRSQRNSDAGEGIYTIGVNGKGLKRVTSGTVRSPSWSPDGRRIAFGRTSVKGAFIFVVKVDGSGLRQLTRDVGQDADSDPAWSPDGRRIVFARDLRLVVVNWPSGAGIKQLTKRSIYATTPDW